MFTDENASASPRTTRSRQHSDSSFILRAFDSPSKRNGRQPEATKRVSGSPRRGAADHLHAVNRSSPLAPVRANTYDGNYRQTQNITPSAPELNSFNSQAHVETKVEGLRLHWRNNEGEEANLHTRIVTLPEKLAQHPQYDAQDCTRQLESHAVTFTPQDLSIPDLQDPETDLSPLDSYFLLSPFTMSIPSFNQTPSPASEPLAVQSAMGDLTIDDSTSPISKQRDQYDTVGTPSSPPQQAFFHLGSTDSFSRFPTPDKLSLGLTPSPGCIAQTSDTLLLPSISPGDPLFSKHSDFLRSASSPILQPESSASSSIHSCSSSSAISEILSFDAASAPKLSTSSGAASIAQNARLGGLSRGDIRQSLLNFPSPPTSPRPFTFGRAAGTLLPVGVAPTGSPLNAPRGQASKAKRSTTAESNSPAYTAPSDDLQASLEELLSAAGLNDFSQPYSQLHFPSSSSMSMRPASLPPTTAAVPDSPITKPASTLPPNIALPPLPPASNSVRPSSNATEHGKQRARASSTLVQHLEPSRAAGNSTNPDIAHSRVAGESTLLGTSANIKPTAPNMSAIQGHLMSSRSLTSSRHEPPTKVAGAPIAKAVQAVPDVQHKQPRKRRTSLSIKIPRMFSRSRKTDDEGELPSSALSPDTLQLPQSRFSPDSDGPTPTTDRLPSGNLMKRLSRAVSSPNLKQAAAAEVSRLPIRREFVTPASAPPVPTTFPSSYQNDSFTTTPVLTPNLGTDIESSLNDDSPTAGASVSETSAFSKMQAHNPYFPIFPPRQSSLRLSSNAGNGSKGPASPRDMAWLYSPPPSSDAPVPPLQAKPSTSVHSTQMAKGVDDRQSDSSSSRGSDSGSGSKAARSEPMSTNRRRTNQASGSSNEDDEDDEEEIYGGHSASSDDYLSSSNSEEEDEESSDEDDVPLAQAHPDALRVQSSLRVKVKAEQRSRRKRKMEKTASIPSERIAKPSTLIDRNRASTSEQTNVQREARLRTASIPATNTYSHRNPFGFAPDELSKKLQKLDAVHERLESLRVATKRPDSSGERPHDLLLPQTDEHVKHRSTSRGRAVLAPPLAPFVQESVLTMSEGSDDESAPLRTQPLRITKPRDRRQSGTDPKGHRTVHEFDMPSKSPVSPRSPVPSQREQSFTALQVAGAFEASAASSSHYHHHQTHTRPHFHSKQIVYINDPQHHTAVDIDEKMTVADLLSHLREKGAISGNPGWVVTEMWRTMGVERPLREYEMLQESIESWSSEANSSLLLVKKSPLAPLLKAPSESRDSPESTGGWVHLEVKRGKWSKRWLEIRGDSLHISKSDKPRDQTVFCHFSNFDAYIVPQACVVKMKTPKPYAFAVKSVDKVSLFENADQDYIHFFSVKTEVEQDSWIRSILQSRSKILSHLATSRALSQANESRLNLISQAAFPTASPHNYALPGGNNISRTSSKSNKSQSPPMPSNTFANNSLLARRPSVAQQPESRKIISSDNLPPLPGGIAEPHYATLPKGKDWERLGHEERTLAIQKAARDARNGGKALLDFGGADEQPVGLLGRSRAKSIGQRR